MNSSIPYIDVWSTYLPDAQAYFPQSNYRLTLLLLVNVPIVAVALNVLWQFVHSYS
jgi:hypothetical protein